MNPVLLRSKVRKLDREYASLLEGVDDTDPEQLRNLKELQAVREEAHALLRALNPKRKFKKRRKKR